MKNIQVIDGAQNCTYEVYQLENNIFELIFPNGQDIEFSEDLEARLGSSTVSEIYRKLWAGRCDKKKINGIHGTLFFDLAFKKDFYPTKKADEMILAL